MSNDGDDFTCSCIDALNRLAIVSPDLVGLALGKILTFSGGEIFATPLSPPPLGV